MKKVSVFMLLAILFGQLFYYPSVKAGSIFKEQPQFTDQTDVVETAAGTDGLNLTCKSSVLMEASTGTVLYENQADEKLPPASITKIMTLILIFDALQEGKISMSDMVTTSEYAKSMGGSQVFLEEGEQQSVETMIKCIVVASGNDASVAMAEHLCGSEAEFVAKMNERAKSLGMENTHFEDCCGLTESENHYTTARDVAIMSRELITKYPKIHDYSTIWMENITHVTKQGSKEFTLANTNKLLKQYQWTTGLKTGSTKRAKYCLSATAKKDGVELIAVVMAAPDYKARFREAMAMLNYGYSNCSIYKDEEERKETVPVIGGKMEEVPIYVKTPFTYVSTAGENLSNIKKEVVVEEVKAPIFKGQEVGKIIYTLGEKKIGEVPLFSAEEVEQSEFHDFFRNILGKYLPDVI